MSQKDDVKVADFSHKNGSADDAQSLMDDIQKQKQNGNFDKARQLGKALANEVDSNDGEFVFGLDQTESADIIAQRRLLLAFMVTWGLDECCRNSLISKVAQNTFLEEIQSGSPAIYRDINQQGAFSYYYLCVRDTAKPGADVGRTFAELCNRKGDCVYAKLGSALFEYFLTFVKKSVAVLDFQ